jgi:hypothetical protein
MRWQFKVLILVILGFVGLDLATSRAQIPGGFGFGGLIGVKDGHTDPLGLLKRAEVKKELRIKPEQLEKIDAAIWEALAKALDPDQLKRLKEIDIQQRDYKAFADPLVQATLKLSKTQKDNIKTIVTESEKEEKTLTDQKNLSAGGIASLVGLPDKLKVIGMQAKERCTDVLNNEQKRLWQEMVGDDFMFDNPKLPFDFGDIGKGVKGGAKKGKAAKG